LDEFLEGTHQDQRNNDYDYNGETRKLRWSIVNSNTTERCYWLWNPSTLWRWEGRMSEAGLSESRGLCCLL